MGSVNPAISQAASSTMLALGSLVSENGMCAHRFYEHREDQKHKMREGTCSMPQTVPPSHCMCSGVIVGQGWTTESKPPLLYPEAPTKDIPLQNPPPELFPLAAGWVMGRLSPPTFSISTFTIIVELEGLAGTGLKPGVSYTLGKSSTQVTPSWPILFMLRKHNSHFYFREKNFNFHQSYLWFTPWIDASTFVYSSF